MVLGREYILQRVLEGKLLILTKISNSISAVTVEEYSDEKFIIANE